MAFRSFGPDPVRAAVHNAFEQRDFWPVASAGSERHNQALASGWLRVSPGRNGLCADRSRSTGTFADDRRAAIAPAGPRLGRRRFVDEKALLPDRLEQNSVPVKVQKASLAVRETTHVDGLCGFDAHSFKRRKVGDRRYD